MARTAEQTARYQAAARAKTAEKALAAGRVPGQIGTPRRLTPEEKEISRITRHKRTSKASTKLRTERRAAKAIVEGRQPGKVGQPRVLTDRERIEHGRWRQAKFRRVHKETLLPYQAEQKRFARKDPKKKEREYESARKYREKNSEVVKFRSHKWYSENKDRHAVLGRNYRARKNSVGGTHTAADIANLLEKQKGKCAWCLISFGTEKPTVDHYIPLARGGSNDVKNLRLLHKSCNSRKSSKDPVDFGLKHGLLAW